VTAPAATATGASVFEGLVGASDIGVLGVGGIPHASTTPGELLGLLSALRSQRGFAHLSLLTAAERPAQVSEDGTAESEAAAGPVGVKMVYTLTRRSDVTHAVITVDLDEGALRVPTIVGLWPGASTLEREVYDLFGVVFVGHPNLRRIVLRDDFEGHPLRKGFDMPASGVSEEQVERALASHATTGRHSSPNSAIRTTRCRFRTPPWSPPPRSRAIPSCSPSGS